MDGNFHLLIKKVSQRGLGLKAPRVKKFIYPIQPLRVCKANPPPRHLLRRYTTEEAFFTNEASWQGAEESGLL